jgi:hypothetical protein
VSDKAFADLTYQDLIDAFDAAPVETQERAPLHVWMGLDADDPRVEIAHRYINGGAVTARELAAALFRTTMPPELAHAARRQRRLDKLAK